MLYILDEPTIGLRNLNLLKTIDYLSDLGPEGGDGDETVVSYGTPQEVMQSKESYTGKYLKNIYPLVVILKNFGSPSLQESHSYFWSRNKV